MWNISYMGTWKWYFGIFEIVDILAEKGLLKKLGHFLDKFHHFGVLDLKFGIYVKNVET